MLLAGSRAWGQANLLLDPGFEAGIDGAPNASSGDVPMQATPGGTPTGPWSGFNQWTYPYSSWYTASIPAHTGTQVAKTFSNSGGVYQAVNANAGDSYTGTGWFVNSSGNGGVDELNGPETDDVRLIFYPSPNGSGNALATDVAPVPVSDLTPLDTWTQLSVTATAPAGTESVVWMAYFNNPNGSGGALFVDDAGLVDNTPAGPATLSWDNAGGTGDGATWDISNNQNWNNETAPAVYTDGSIVTFNDTNNSHYAVTLNTTVKPGSLTTNSSGNYTISGSGTIGGTSSLTKSGSGTLTLSTANTYSGGTIVNSGLLKIEPTSATTSALPTGAVKITGGTLQLADNVTAGSQSSNPPATSPASNVNITSLAISGNGTLDIGNNHIMIDYTSGNDPIDSIAALIASGYDNGGANSWKGTGITSSDAAANSGSYGIGYADGADLGNPAGLVSGQIEIMYTLLGDANLDGKVNGSDFTLMASSFNDLVTAGWDKGDFNYSNSVNGDDFVLLANNFNRFASQSAISAADLSALDAFASSNGISLTSVPEPASTGLLLSMGAGLLFRRRKQDGR